MYEAAEGREEDPGELGMLSQMLVSRASGRGEQLLMAEVGLAVWAVTPSETRLELATGHLLAHALWFPNEPGLPGEPGALSWEMVRTLRLLANVVKWIASWVGRTPLLRAEHWGVPKSALSSESRRRLPGTAVQITGALPRGPCPTPQAG